MFDMDALTLALLSKWKIITQSQAVDVHALIGYIGGYIGLFLGIEMSFPQYDSIW